jgi:biopolymer transport protein ExbD
MPKVQVKRQSVSLDMTAMCDVAFLLLTFFMLTAKFRPQEAAPVITPSSVSDTAIPTSELITISVSGDNKVFLGVDAQPVRDGMLEKMGEKNGLQFTVEERQAFRTTEDFGVPAGSLKQMLAMSPDERNKPGVQPGIPVDSAKNELSYWVLYARMYNPRQRIAIKADQNANYETVEKVIATLQAQKINQFNLVTSMENKPASMKKEKDKK